MFRKLLPGILGGWIVVGVLAFRKLPGPIAVLVITVVGTLFLPEVHSTQNNAVVGSNGDGIVPDPYYLCYLLASFTAGGFHVPSMIDGSVSFGQ
jgi:uncharacterized YccA/Bax inhibitor family protein